MPKSKVVSIRVPMDDYYSFLEQAAANKVPIATWALKVLNGDVVVKMKKGGTITRWEQPVYPLKRILYVTEVNGSRTLKPTNYYTNGHNIFDANKNLYKLSDHTEIRWNGRLFFHINNERFNTVTEDE